MNTKTCRNMIGILFICLLLCACSPSATQVRLTRYEPDFSTSLSAYKDKRVYLMNFDNQDWNTTNFLYYSPDKRFAYTGDSLLHNYFWYAFEKAFVGSGMLVSNAQKPDPAGVPLWLTLRSITDDRYEVDVKIRVRENMIFIKTYSVSGDPIAEAAKTPDNLEKRAYRMTNQLIGTILADPAFRETLLKTAAELSTVEKK